MEKKSKLIPILIGIIVLLVLAIGAIFIIFGDAIWNQASNKKEEDTATETKKILTGKPNTIIN